MLYMKIICIRLQRTSGNMQISSKWIKMLKYKNNIIKCYVLKICIAVENPNTTIFFSYVVKDTCDCTWDRKVPAIFKIFYTDFVDANLLRHHTDIGEGHGHVNEFYSSARDTSPKRIESRVYMCVESFRCLPAIQITSEAFWRGVS